MFNELVRLKFLTLNHKKQNMDVIEDVFINYAHIPKRDAFAIYRQTVVKCYCSTNKYICHQSFKI